MRFTSLGGRVNMPSALHGSLVRLCAAIVLSRCSALFPPFYSRLVGMRAHSTRAEDKQRMLTQLTTAAATRIVSLFIHEWELN